jgi:phosphate:Na+ symporter
LLERLIADSRVKEVARLKHVDAPRVSAPVLGLEQSHGEVVQMSESVHKMAAWIRQLGFNGPWDEGLVQKVYHREEILDNVQGEVVQFLTDLLDATVPHAVAEEGRQQLRLAHEYESISDRYASILRNFDRLRQKRLLLAPAQQSELLEAHDLVAGFTRSVGDAFAERRPMGDADARAMSTEITRKLRKLQDDHLQRMIDGPIDPHLSMIFTSMLTDYRRVRAHAFNVHEATGGSGGAQDE